LCDAASQLSLEELEPMLERLLKIDAVVKGF
jgi:3-deoxy-D-manno-octulosonic acid (KDO) 8-phosphate synthase